MFRLVERAIQSQSDRDLQLNRGVAARYRSVADVSSRRPSIQWPISHGGFPQLSDF